MGLPVAATVFTGVEAGAIIPIIAKFGIGLLLPPMSALTL